MSIYKVSLVKGYPEHDKMMAQRCELDAVGSFLEYLEGEGIYLADTDPLTLKLYPLGRTHEALLAGWSGIDQAELSAEKDRMLHSIQVANAIRESKEATS